MSLLDVLRSGVKTIDKITQPLQSTVTYRRFLSGTGDGGHNLGPPVTLEAIVDYKLTRVEVNGVLMVTRATVIFLDVKTLSTATSGFGVQTNDQITLQDGTTSPVRAIGGFMDPGTGVPVATEGMIG